MSSALFNSNNSVFRDTGVSFAGKEGYHCRNNSGVMAVGNSATVPSVALCLEGAAADKDSSFVPLGAAGVKVRVKLSGTVGKYARLQQANDGTFVTDAGSGGRVIAALALEAGVSGDLIEAVLLTPTILS